MIEVLVEVRSGVARFGVAVRAESIERAVGLASVRYPGSEVGVLFPIDPDAFFREEPVPAVGPILPEELAG